MDARSLGLRISDCKAGLPVSLRTLNNGKFARTLKMSNDSPSPSPDSKAPEPQITGDDAKNKGYKTHEQLPSGQLSRPNPLPDPPHKTDAEQRQNAPNEWRRNSIERALFFVEIFGLLGLAWYCWLTHGELKVFDSERKTMETEFVANQTNAIQQLEAIQNQLRAMTNQTTVMQRQLDDAEAQQRAILQFGDFSFKLEDFHTNSKIEGLPTNLIITHFTFQDFFTLKNVGATPAIDLAGYGEGFPEGKSTNKPLGTNGLKKWDHNATPIPQPKNSILGSKWIMPQETFTNGIETISEDMPLMDDWYIERWVSYRDIFNHPWIVGEGGHYDFTSLTFIPEFIYSGPYRDTNQTTH